MIVPILFAVHTLTVVCMSSLIQEGITIEHFYHHCIGQSHCPWNRNSISINSNNKYIYGQHALIIFMGLEHAIVALQARIPLIIEIVFDIAPTFPFCMQRLLGTVLEGVVSVAYNY